MASGRSVPRKVRLHLFWRLWRRWAACREVHPAPLSRPCVGTGHMDMLVLWGLCCDEHDISAKETWKAMCRSSHASGKAEPLQMVERQAPEGWCMVATAPSRPGAPATHVPRAEGQDRRLEVGLWHPPEWQGWHSQEVRPPLGKMECGCGIEGRRTKLHHPHLVQALELGAWPETASGGEMTIGYLVDSFGESSAMLCCRLPLRALGYAMWPTFSPSPRLCGGYFVYFGGKPSAISSCSLASPRLHHCVCLVTWASQCETAHLVFGYHRYHRFVILLHWSCLGPRVCSCFSVCCPPT